MSKSQIEYPRSPALPLRHSLNRNSYEYYSNSRLMDGPELLMAWKVQFGGDCQDDPPNARRCPLNNHSLNSSPSTLEEPGNGRGHLQSNPLKEGFPGKASISSFDFYLFIFVIIHNDYFPCVAKLTPLSNYDEIAHIACEALCWGSFDVQDQGSFKSQGKISIAQRMKHCKEKLSQPPAVDMQHAPVKLPSKLHLFEYVYYLAQSLCSLHSDTASKLGNSRANFPTKTLECLMSKKGLYFQAPPLEVCFASGTHQAIPGPSKWRVLGQARMRVPSDQNPWDQVTKNISTIKKSKATHHNDNNLNYSANIEKIINENNIQKIEKKTIYELRNCKPLNQFVHSKNIGGKSNDSPLSQTKLHLVFHLKEIIQKTGCKAKKTGIVSFGKNLKLPLGCIKYKKFTIRNQSIINKIVSSLGRIKYNKSTIRNQLIIKKIIPSLI
ncbi:hypothetical protein VP01_567g1 [Puccinia sorghi]|uniref:Uncharacterized protein n=1 Tax=Puccinia sorghi TaxID=27349 RepID=A0A0L6UJI0_9BASI|nr:hypothetical protein VP01_567g1 [Puccinia sorghi]